jgi:DNA-binding response OmpR family regulator
MSHIKMLSLDEKTITSELDRAGYRKMGIQVKSALTWSEAGRVLAEGDVDIVVVNLDVSTLDALDVIKHIRLSEWKDVPIVATSVQSSPKIRNTAVKTGADLFVEQPVPRDYFIEKIKSLLDQKTRTTERVNADVEVTFVLKGKSIQCPVGDLSVSGVLLSTDLELNHGELIDLHFTLGASSKAVKVKGEVVRRIESNKKNSHQMTGVGVRFVEFSGDSQQRIESFVARTADKTNKMAYYL